VAEGICDRSFDHVTLLGMLVLHAGFLGQSDESPARFAIWGEDAASSPSKPPSKKGASRKSKDNSQFHSYCASIERLNEALTALEREAGQSAQAYAFLPSIDGLPLPSRRFLLDSEPKGQPALKVWKVNIVALPVMEALEILAAIPINEDGTPGIEIGIDLAFWKKCGQFALSLVANQKFLPDLIERDGRHLAVWSPVLLGDDRANFETLASAMPPAARALARYKDTPETSPRSLLTSFIDWSVDGLAGSTVRFPKRPKKPAASPGEKWILALTAGDPEVQLPADFITQQAEWRRPDASAHDGNFRICFRLDPPEAEPERTDAGKETWALRYFLQAEDDPSLLVPADMVWRERGSTLRFVNRKFDMPQERLLAGLGLAERMFSPIADSLALAQPTACDLTTAQAYSFMREAALLLTSSGFGVLMPGLAGKLNLRLKLSSKRTGASPKGASPSVLSMAGIVNFDWQVAIGDEVLSKADFEKLASLKVPLVQIRGEWVEFSQDQIKQALDFLEKGNKAGQISIDQALRASLDSTVAGLPVAAIEAEGWVGELLDQALGRSQIKQIETPQDFIGTLRPYQSIGFSWLAFLRGFGLGACLADDMGLGKTVQTIALLLHLRKAGNTKPGLLICPTSVVGNWEREVQRFAPTLNVLIHHGSGRSKSGLDEQAAGKDLVISSYALLHRDLAHLSDIEWGEVILDEAQNVKNPGTRQAQAARSLKAEHKVALTGTPVENRLSELWSIFQFLNPGYLGSHESFRRQFENPIVRNADQNAAGRLRSLTAPFLLRRVKTDPSVIDDLPAKNEIRVFCNLTREQGTLYEAVVRDSLKQIEASDGIKRRGVVLATLMKLKQVCNHPAQFLKDGSSLQERSGKVNRLIGMLEEARSSGDHSLVFTQFAEMGTLLKGHVESAFGDEVFFLHGGTPASARQRMVERFQEDPHAPFVFLLSIKAGGTGLNLTRATSVFHFDRWWNPAVENQATDRAFRIGQKRSVQVYKYVCAGTVEERIDEMIESKKELAGKIVGTSESWISELSTDQLKEIFTLRKESIE
jgi:superfamily II DNA or RNA helicase